MKHAIAYGLTAGKDRLLHTIPLGRLRTDPERRSRHTRNTRHFISRL
jgi:hypothetical protein